MVSVLCSSCRWHGSQDVSRDTLAPFVPRLTLSLAQVTEAAGLRWRLALRQQGRRLDQSRRCSRYFFGRQTRSLKHLKPGSCGQRLGLTALGRHRLHVGRLGEGNPQLALGSLQCFYIGALL